MNHPTQKTDAQNGALAGLRILDATRLLPGAFCTQIMADMGAEVIKIEHPDGGDYNRSFPPIAKEESGSYLLLNRNKKSLTLNLKSETGREIFCELIKTTDIFIEGFRPGVMDRLGLGYDHLKTLRPELIYCAISGYGQTGPYRLKPGHDLNYMAIAGALPLFGKAGEGPMVPGLSIADVGGGSLTAIAGVLAAVISRHTSGKGQYVDISMTDGAMSWLSLHGADYLYGGIEPKGGERPFIGQAPCYNIYQCKDEKYVALGIIEEHFWQRFCDAVGLSELKDQQWPEGEDAARQFEILRTLFADKTQSEWLAFLDPADIPFTAVNTMEDALADPQMQNREMALSMEHPVEGNIPQLGFPIKLSDTPCQLTLPPPLLGEHNEELLSTLGYDAAAQQGLKQQKVI